MAKKLPVLVRLYIVWGQLIWPRKDPSPCVSLKLIIHNMWVWVCEQAKRQLEIQTGIKAQVILPTPGQKTNRTNKKLPGTQGKICGPRTPIWTSHFRNPRKRNTTTPLNNKEESSPSDETPGKTMKTGTTEEWKKVVQKSRRKASPISKKNGTISYNPKQNGSKTENYGKTRKHIN